MSVLRQSTEPESGEAESGEAESGEPESVEPESVDANPEQLCLRMMQRCVVERPDCMDVRARLALCYAAVGDPLSAEVTLRTAVEMDPGHVPTRLHLGWLLELLGRRGEAAGEYRAVLAQDPAHPEARRRVVELAHEQVRVTDRGDEPDWWAAQVAHRLDPVG